MAASPKPRLPPLDASIFFAKGSRPSQPLQGHGFLVHGARAAGKTSLAFQAVINTVERQSGDSSGDGNDEDRHVIVLCQESAFYAKVPVPFTPLSSVSEAALGRIEFVYVNTWLGVLRELMELRTPEAVPPLILIDDDGFESEAPQRRGGGRRGGNGPPTDASASSAAAACLSYLANVHDWMARNNKPFTYVVVTNELPESALQLSLPFAAFPLVNVWVGASGVVQMTPVPADAAVVAPVYLTWRNGLQLQ